MGLVTADSSNTEHTDSFHYSFCILSELADWERNLRAWTVWWSLAGMVAGVNNIYFVNLRRPSVPEISTIDNSTNKHLKASRSKSYNTREENYRVIKCERLNKEKIIEEIDLLIPFSIYERLASQWENIYECRFMSKMFCSNDVLMETNNEFCVVCDKEWWSHSCDGSCYCDNLAKIIWDSKLLNFIFRSKILC